MGHSRTNILFLLSDEHSFRYMSHLSFAAGGEPAHTPHLDALAGQGGTFTHTYCPVPVCAPSRMSFLTGLEAQRSGGWGNGDILAPDLPTIPSVLSAAGYATALIGKMHFGGTLQFHGFQHRPYGDLLGNTGHQWETLNPHATDDTTRRTRDAGTTQIPASKIQDEVVAQETLAYLREHRHAHPEQPWFACASFSRPHFPLTAPRRHLDRYWPVGVTEPRVPASGDAYDHPMSVNMRRGFHVDRISHAEMMRARAAYFACVTYLDEIIGDLLLRLDRDGLLENTIVVYASDHGEMAGEHGTWWKNGWYEACTRVPFLVSMPEHRTGRLPPLRVSVPVSLLDLLPTLCGLVGLPIPAALDGADLSAVIRTGASAPDRPIFCDSLTPRWGVGTEFRAVRQRNWKYVQFRAAPALLFDLATDPDEQRNLVVSPRGDARDMLEYFQQLVSRTLNFDESEARRKSVRAELKTQYEMPLPERPGNQYLMPSGQLIDADDTLYSPKVLVASPASFFPDWPGRR